MNTIERLLAKGIRRTGSPASGFEYVEPDGRPVSGVQRHRIDALKIPPAWEEVRVHPSPGGRVQAIGKDRAGRWQYRYHAAQARQREAEKAERLLHFAAALPRMRRMVAADLALSGLPRRKVLACILRILETCFLRPGSAAYASEKGGYGIATLRPRHVTVRGDRVIFDFKGKSGQLQHRELRDRKIAVLVRRLLKAPGRDVFKFAGENGGFVDVRRRHINDYIKDVMGERFSAKDFRTWAGTLLAACALARAGTDGADSLSVRRRKIVAAVKETARHLGNTPAVCRSAYINGSVLTRFEKGEVLDRWFDTLEEYIDRRTHGLHPAERAVLALLRRDAKRRISGRRQASRAVA